MPEALETDPRKMADLLKEAKNNPAKLDEFRLKLAEDSLEMPTAQFANFFSRLQAENARDVSLDKYLPKLDVSHKEHLDGTPVEEVDVTTPGKIMGNLWRDSQDVLYRECDGTWHPPDRELFEIEQAKLREIFESIEK